MKRGKVEWSDIERGSKRGPRKDRKQGRMLYFAYGSNLHIAQMKGRCRDAIAVCPAKLKGWRLVFRGVADVVPSTRGVVHGGLWSITPADLKALDRYEGFPDLYYRRWVELETEHGPAEAIVYVMTTTSGYRTLPSPGYLRTCTTGFSAWGLPHWVIRRALKEAGGHLLDRGITEGDLLPKGKALIPRGYAPPWQQDIRERVRRAGELERRLQRAGSHTARLGHQEPRGATPGMTRATRMELGFEEPYTPLTRGERYAMLEVEEGDRELWSRWPLTTEEQAEAETWETAPIKGRKL